LDGDGFPEEVVVVAQPTHDGGRYWAAVLKPWQSGYVSQVLYRGVASELEALRVVSLSGGRRSQILLVERGGSGGFLSVRVFGWTGRSYARLFELEGIYQGRYRLRRVGHRRRGYVLHVVRAIQGDVNAYPRGEWRESYRWTAAGFILASRRRVALRRRVKLSPGPSRLPTGHQ
jgi:hypothetical protein